MEGSHAGRTVIAVRRRLALEAVCQRAGIRPEDALIKETSAAAWVRSEANLVAKPTPDDTKITSLPYVVSVTVEPLIVFECALVLDALIAKSDVPSEALREAVQVLTRYAGGEHAGPGAFEVVLAATKPLPPPALLAPIVPEASTHAVRQLAPHLVAALQAQHFAVHVQARDLTNLRAVKRDLQQRQKVLLAGEAAHPGQALDQLITQLTHERDQRAADLARIERSPLIKMGKRLKSVV